VFWQQTFTGNSTQPNHLAAMIIPTLEFMSQVVAT
jgi:hypothetical protein